MSESHDRLDLILDVIQISDSQPQIILPTRPFVRTVYSKIICFCF